MAKMVIVTHADRIIRKTTLYSVRYTPRRKRHALQPK